MTSSKALQGFGLLLFFAAIPAVMIWALRPSTASKAPAAERNLAAPVASLESALAVGTHTPPSARSTVVAPLPITASPSIAAPSASDSDMRPGAAEAELMAKLRQLADSDPEQSLRLAADGNARFADSPDAPERAWRTVKSLVNLKRFHDARDEAELMVARYPGTSWSLDVQRHLLVYPLDQPSREEQQKQLQE